MPSKKVSSSELPLDSDCLGAGDTFLIHPLLAADIAVASFNALLTTSEVQWQVMHHRGGPVPRLVAVQGSIDPLTNAFPIYRHPADQSPELKAFTETVDAIRKEAEKHLDHPLNHVLIQKYRGGSDHITEHSDKTLDIVRGTKIVNVSLGAQRTMTLRLKKDAMSKEVLEEHSNLTQVSSAQTQPTPRPAQRIPLPHNSLFVLGPITNKRFLHGINHDNRPISLKSPEEQAFDGERISLTFRLIGTFLIPVSPSPSPLLPTSGVSSTQVRIVDTSSSPRQENPQAEPEPAQHLIFGQGATSKSPSTAKVVPSGAFISTPEVQKNVKALICAFGEENYKSEFDWDTWYGSGFDVVHFV